MLINRHVGKDPMPPVKAARKTARPALVRPARKAAAPEPEPANDRPTMHNGIAIVTEERVPSPLPKGGPFRYNRTQLADGTTGYSCIDCSATTDTRGEIMAHRNEAHGSRYGQKKPRVVLAESAQVLDVVLPEREEGPAPDSFYAMTLGEILALAPSIQALGDLIDRLERERDEAVLALDDARIDKETQRKIDVYETNRQEIIDLRLIVNRQKDYDAIRAEVVQLRSWKRRMTTRLKDLGFKLEEDED